MSCFEAGSWLDVFVWWLILKIILLLQCKERSHYREPFEIHEQKSNLDRRHGSDDDNRRGLNTSFWEAGAGFVGEG